LENRFDIIAFDEEGNRYAVSVNASTQSEAVQKVALRGLRDVRVKRSFTPSAARGGHISLAGFNRELASVIEAGIPLEEGISEIAQGTARGPLRKALEEVSREVAEGVPLEEAVGRREGVFPAAYARLLRAAAVSGDLSGVLRSYSEEAEQLDDLARDVRMSLAYPFAVLALLLGLSALGLFVAIPSMQSLVSRSYGTDGSREIGRMFHPLQYAMAAVLAAAGLILLTWLVLMVGRRISPALAAFAARISRRLPIAGKMFADLARARFYSTLGSMIEREVPLHEALGLAAAVSMRPNLEEDVRTLSGRIHEGVTFAEAIRESRVLPPADRWLLQVSDTHGDLAGTLRDLARTAREEALGGTEKIRVAVLPVALLFVGASIFSISALFFLTIFKIAGLSR